MNACCISWPADHPAAAGHFPGNPIIPGAILLRDITRAIAAAHPGEICSHVIAAKFLQPVRPGDVVTVSWTGASDVRFRGHRSADGIDVVTGALRLAPA